MRAPRGVSLTHSAHTMPARANQKKIIFKGVSKLSEEISERFVSEEVEI